MDNARRIRDELAIPLLAWVPIVPGYNDSVENIEATAEFIATELGNSIKVHLVPYHRLGETKYEKLEMAYNSVSIESPSEDYVLKLKQIVEFFRLTAYLGV